MPRDVVKNFQSKWVVRGVLRRNHADGTQHKYGVLPWMREELDVRGFS